jgi:hypothetical protein
MSGARFTVDELVAIIDGTRLRSKVRRTIGPELDLVDVLLPHMPGCAYRFARDATGWTYLLHVAPEQTRLLVAGTLAECLTLIGVPVTGKTLAEVM